MLELPIIVVLKIFINVISIEKDQHTQTTSPALTCTFTGTPACSSHCTQSGWLEKAATCNRLWPHLELRMERGQGRGGRPAEERLEL